MHVVVRRLHSSNYLLFTDTMFSTDDSNDDNDDDHERIAIRSNM